MHRDGRNQGGDSQHQENVRNVGSDDVTDGDTHGIALNRLKTGYEFGYGRAKTDQGQTDHKFRDVKLSRNANRTPNECLAPYQQEYQSAEDQKIHHCA